MVHPVRDERKEREMRDWNIARDILKRRNI